MFKTIIKFISEARTELMKVTWPTRKTVINHTLTVIAVSIAFAIFISGVDYTFTQGIKLLTTFSGSQSSNVTATPINIGIDDIEIGIDGGEIQIETEPIE